MKDVAPVAQPRSVQIIRYLKHQKTGDATLAASGTSIGNWAELSGHCETLISSRLSVGDAPFEISER